MTKAHSLGEALGRKVDDAAYTLGRAPNWEPGASIKGLLRDGFKTLGDAGEVLTKADTLDEASAVIPQFTEGTTTVDQALALFPGLEREYPDFNCP